MPFFPRSLSLCPFALGLVLLAVAASACEGCEERPPTVPFHLASGAPSSAPAPADSPPGSAPAFAVVRGQKAAGDGKAWPVGKRNLSAPTGQRFDVGLVVDATGDGHDNLLAWTVRKRGGPDGVWVGSVAPDAPEGLELAAPAIGDESDCEIEREVKQIGLHTVVFERRSRCLDAATPTVWSGIVRLAGQGSKNPLPELLLTVRSAPPSPARQVDLAFDAGDLDGDGRDDLTVRLHADGDLEPFEGASALDARLVYFDRPAGLSRDPAEPRRALAAHAKKILKDAGDPEAAKSVAARARQLELFERALCEELGSPSVLVQSRGVACGDGPLVGDAVLATGLAALTLGDPLAALAQERRLQALLPAEAKKLERLAKALEKAIPARAVHVAHRMSARPVRPTPGAVGPFTFDSGALFVMSLAGVVRIDLGSFEEAPVDMPGWAARLSSAKLSPPPLSPAVADESADEGADENAVGPPPSPPPPPQFQLLGVAQRCEAPHHVATVMASGSRHEIALPALGWFDEAGRTAPHCAAGDTAAVALGAHDQGAFIALGLQAIELRTGEGGPSARPIVVPTGITSGAPGGASTSDKTTVVTRGDEIVVLGTDAPERFTHADLDSPENCAVAPGALFVACRVGGAGLVLSPTR